MSSKLMKAKKSTSITSGASFTEETKTEGSKEPPAGANILSKEVRTSVEEIENGFILSRNYDIRYKAKGSTETQYTYYTKKYFSKTNPVTIKVNQKALADDFAE